MEKQIFQSAVWLLSVAFMSGLVMAGMRFSNEKPSPPWLAKIHGFAAASALTLLVFAWLNTAFPKTGIYGVFVLVAATAGGLVLNLRYHWNQKALPEWLVFAHMTLGFVGFFLVALAAVALSSLPQ